MKAPNVQLTIDLNSVSYMSFYYKNQFGHVRRKMPRNIAVQGTEIINPKDHAFPYQLDYPKETVEERLRRRELLDVWTPICKYHFRQQKSFHFEGEEAKKRRDAYNKHIYGNK